MIKSVTMYSVVCDRCGKTFIDEFNGIGAWLDEGTAKEQAMESEWAEIGDKVSCSRCDVSWIETITPEQYNSYYTGDIVIRINPAKKDGTRSNRLFVLFGMEIDNIKKID